MSTNDSSHDFHDELLSAYLDNELTPAERARVEERLAVDPVARQVLDELRSVSQAMQRLPQQKLSEDLSPAVLARAKEAQPTNGKAVEAATKSIASTGVPVLPPITFGRTRRGWVWAAMTVAAAMMVMYFNREPQQAQNLPSVAESRKAPAASEATKIARDVPEMRSLEEQSGGRVEKPEDLKRLISGTDAEKLSDAGNEAVDGVSTRGELNGRDTVNDASDMKLKGLVEGRGRQATPAGGREMGRANSDDLAMNATGAQLANRGQVGEAQPMDRYGGRTDLDRLGFDKAKLADADKQVADGIKREEGRESDLLDARGGSINAAGGMGATSGTPANIPAPTATVPTAATESSSHASTLAGATSNLGSDGVLVVYVNVKPEALRDRAIIDGKLAQSGIAIDTAAAATLFDNFAPKNDTAESNVEQYKHNFYAYFGDELKKTDPSQTDAILVDAPAARVAGLLAALDADADNVVGISIEDKQPTESEAKTKQISQLSAVDWTKFNRVTLPEPLRSRFAQQAQEQVTGVVENGSVARGMGLADQEAGQARRAGGGRGNAGGGGGGLAGGGGRIGGGGVGGRGRGGRGATPANEPTPAGQPVVAGPPANQGKAVSGEESAAARGAAAAETTQSSSNSGGFGANQAGQGGGQPGATGFGATSPSQQANGGLQMTSGFGGGAVGQRGGRGGGGGARRGSSDAPAIAASVPAGRATRLLLSSMPQGQGNANQLLTKQQEQAPFGFQKAQSAEANKALADQPAAARPGMSSGQPTAGQSNEGLVAGSARSRQSATDESKMSGETVGKELRAKDAEAGEKSLPSATTTLARERSVNERDATERQNAAAETQQRGDSLQVLFVLRAMPAAPTAESAVAPATSRPAADQAK